MRFFFPHLAILLASYLLLCALAFLYQSKLVFFPDRRLVTSPDRHGLQFKEIGIESGNGDRLHGWFLPADSATRALLYFHGNAGNISHRIESLGIFVDLGLSVLIFDYRGYGKSEGRPGEAKTYEDGRAAWEYLVRQEGFRPDEIFLFGRSLGGSVAIRLATDVEPAGLVVESCFPSITEMGVRVYPWLPVRILSRIRYDSESRVSTLTCDKLFIHSRQDDVVPFDMGRRLYEMASEPKRFLEISGDHNSGFLTSGRTYTEGLWDFFSNRSGAVAQ